MKTQAGVALDLLHGGRQGVMRLWSLSKNIAMGLRVGLAQVLPAYIDALSRMRFDGGNSRLFHSVLPE